MSNQSEYDAPQERRKTKLSDDERVMLSSHNRVTVGTAILVLGALLTGHIWLSTQLSSLHDEIAKYHAEADAQRTAMENSITSMQTHISVWTAFLAERNPTVRVPVFSDVQLGANPRNEHHEEPAH